jgi:hypothetical protein
MPLVISDDEFEEALQILQAGVTAIAVNAAPAPSAHGEFH